MIKDVIKKTVLYEPAKYLYGKWMYYLPLRYRYGKIFTNTWQFLSESEFWSEEKIAEYQLGELKRLIDHVYNNVPYYQKLFKEIGFHPNDFRDFSDLQSIPYLTKDLINEHRETLVDQSFLKKHQGYGTTGGSTGVPMGFYYDKRISSAQEWAFMTHQWKRVGYKHRDKCIILRGNVIKGSYVKKHKYWAHNYASNSLILSSYHLTDENIRKYIELIREYRPKFIKAYPSALMILVDYMKQHNIKTFETLKAVLCGSENLYEWQRKLFNEVLRTRVYSWYGHTERICLAGECEQSYHYHAYPQYGYTELVNEDNKWCKKEDETGEIVATGFGNYVMPFIRYKTQDIGINTNQKCECGRNWKNIKGVEGRLQDYVIGKNNERITLTALIFAQHFKSFGKMQNMQLCQKEKGVVEVRVVEKFPLNAEDRRDIITKMTIASDNSLQINIKTVKNIKRTQAGKHRFLIQEVSL